MDASTYGRLVERGGYAAGGIVQEPEARTVLVYPWDARRAREAGRTEPWGWLPDRAKRHANPPLGVTYGLDGPSPLARLLAGPMVTTIRSA